MPIFVMGTSKKYMRMDWLIGCKDPGFVLSNNILSR